MGRGLVGGLAEVLSSNLGVVFSPTGQGGSRSETTEGEGFDKEGGKVEDKETGEGACNG